jgi:hypothetical protein
LSKESFPEEVVVNQMLVDRYDNLWIAGHSTLLCRKANGEYVLYNPGNSPLQKSLVIQKMFLFGDELRLIIDESSLDKDDGLPKNFHSPGILRPLKEPDPSRLKTFIVPQQVLIYDITKQK